MKMIAFKRANIPSLPKTFITEWIDAGLLESLEGYESLSEPEFKVELSKNPRVLEEHQKYLENLEHYEKQYTMMKKVELTKEERELQREFNQFKAWKKSGGKK